jgi:hypothetical protein
MFAFLKENKKILILKIKFINQKYFTIFLFTIITIKIIYIYKGIV